jgi:fimbrial isopeptide formation D2 family protein/uncharacterized repeat protein (TIGR01451 family)
MQVLKALIRVNLLAGAIALVLSQPAIAEGSRELVKNGGNRPFTEWRTGSTGGILRRTVLKVYANAGETIHLGSSAIGVGSGNILLFAQGDNVDSATPKLNCGTATPLKGKMTTRAQELAGPLAIAAGGYDSCQFTSTTAETYQVVFYGPDGATGDNDPITNANTDYIANPLLTTDQKSTVSMWDITVTNAGVEQKGRVFTDYVAMIMGDNGRYLKSELYILTRDGYRYLTNLNKGSGLDPNGFVFFANTQGLLRPDGQPLYRTAVKSSDNTMTPPLNGGVTIQPPDYPVFFNPPSNEASTALGIPLIAVAPAGANNFQFVAGAGGTGNQTLQGIGGTFSFDSPQNGNYQIIIDTNDNGVYNAAEGDIVLEGDANPGSNTVTWDGTDNTGAFVSPRAGNAPYQSRIILKGGEYHFPLLDAESNSGGFRIEMLNPPGAFSNGATTTTIYFDERDYKVNGTNVSLACASPTVPICDGRGGVDSATGGHRFGSSGRNPNDYGDKKAIDTWIYFPSAAAYTPIVVVPVVNIQGKKSVRFLTDVDGDGKVTVGDRVEYTITYSNLAPVAVSDATSFVIYDALPAQLTYVPSSATITKTAGNNISLRTNYTGTGSTTAIAGGTLRKGDTVTIKFAATINADNGGTAIPNQARATFSKTGSPATPILGTVFTDADAAGATANPPTPGVPFFQTADDGLANGNDPTTTADDDPTLITVVPASPPKLRLVKRLTAIQATILPDYIDVVNGVGDTDDNAATWVNPSVTAVRSDSMGTTANFSNYLKGIVDGALLPSDQRPKPNDEVEYTIYFLSDGGKPANNVSLCDFVPANTTFVPSSIQLVIGSGAPVLVTDTTTTDSDGGFYNSSTITFPAACTGGTNNNQGAIVVNVGNVVNATSPGTANSYGYIRFRAKVN